MADEKYRLQLEGDQIDDALMQMFLRAPEGWTQGTRDGVAVGSGSQYYHNNAKWFAEQAATSAARAEGAIPSGTAGAVFFDRAQTLTAPQRAQARANIKAGGSNPNLLDNPWFTVNQSEFTSSTAATRTICVDRWDFARGTATRNSDGSISITKTDGQSSAYLAQRLEKSMLSLIVGETVAISAVIDSNLYTASGTVQNGNGFNHLVANGVSLALENHNSNYGECIVYITDSNTHTISRVKFEKGNYSTLANDGPPNYKTELDKCIYYRRVFGVWNSIIVLANGYVNAGGTSATFSVPGILRNASPTVTFQGLYLRTYGSDTNRSFTNMSAACSRNYINVTVSGVSGLTAGDPVQLVGTSGGRIILSANP